MTGKLTDYSEFKVRQAKRAGNSVAAVAPQACVSPSEQGEQTALETYDRLVALMEETARLVKELESDHQRTMSRAVAKGEPAPRDMFGALIRGYERLSWKLHGQLRHILDTSRKY